MTQLLVERWRYC